MGGAWGALIEEWMNQVRSLHEAEYYSALGRKEGCPDARVPRVTLEDAMLSGISQ